MIKRKIDKKWLIPAGAVLLVAVVLVVVLWKKPDKELDYHQIVAAAMEKTESEKGFVIQLYSTGTLSIENASQTVQTNGYLYASADSDYTSIYVNTSSSTENAEAEDFNVTVAMYCDGQDVYDNTGNSPVKMDMTCEEFQQIVGEYGLYHYDVADATEITYTENTMEQYNGGQYSVSLTKPSDTVLEAYAGVIADATEETVTKEDLKVVSAYVLYSIYDDALVTQTCSFTVQYTMADGRTASYHAMNQIAYLESLDEVLGDTSAPNEEELS